MPRSVVSVAVFTVKTAIVLVAGFALVAGASWWVVRPLAQQVNQQQIFTVQGQAKRLVQPDTAIVTVGSEMTGANPSELQRQADQAVNKTRDQLVAAGINAADIRTSQYNLSPWYDYSSSKRVLKGYTMTIELEVRTTKLDLVNKVIDTAVANELNRIGGVQFKVENEEQIKRELREEAVKDADKQAKQLAKSSGLDLGKVINVVEGGYYLPISNSLMGDKAVSAPGAAESRDTSTTTQTQVNPGQNEMTMTVTVYYEVK